MIKTACQQAAARVIQFAIRDGAATILVEDYQTIVPHIDDDGARFLPKWPWAQFKGAVDWAAKKAGLSVVEVPAEYISQKCPACGKTCPENVGWWKKLNERERAEEKALAADQGPALEMGDGPPRGPEAVRTHAIAVFSCVDCGLKRNTDTIAAFNMLAAYGLGDGPRQKFEASLRALAKQQKLRGMMDAAE
jgi:transposase